MASTMTFPGFFLLFLSCCMFGGHLGAGFGDLIHINPSIAAAASVQPSYVTQTVYGFLDFTTTIGNTVMVFSPQSAAADPEKEKTTESVVNAVIDTKPVTSVEIQPFPTIKPSKTQSKTENNPSEQTEKISTVGVVSAQSKVPAVILSKVELKSEPSSQVNVIQNSANVVNSHEGVRSKIEVVAVPVSKVSQKSVITKVEVISGTSKVQPPPVISSRVEVYEGPSSSLATPLPDLSSDVDVHAAEEAIIVGNNIGEPEYDFLSRQPSEVVEETYKIINLKPSSKFHLKPRSSVEHKNRQASTARSDPLHPTGLVTKLGGTIVKDGVTTVHETKVIGTYIAGKYAQVLQSTSSVLHQNSQKGKIKASPTLRILKTAAPLLGKSNKHHHLEPTPVSSVVVETAVAVESAKSSRKSNGNSKRFKSRVKEHESPEDNETREVTTASTFKRGGNKARPTQASRSTTKQHTSQRSHKRNKKNGGKTARLATVSVHSDPYPTTTPASRKYQSRKNSSNKQKTSSAPSDSHTVSSRRSFKQRSSHIHPSTVEPSHSSTSVYKFKLNRAPGRWQYKTTSKPKVTIRRQSEDEGNNVTIHTNGESDFITPHSKSDDHEGLVGSESIATPVDDETSTENKVDSAFHLETIKVEISTPPDFKDTYYEIATIKSPYTFKVGTVRNTRYVTVTSTFQKTLDSSTVDNGIVPTHSEPLTENILATASHYEKDNNFLDSSVATLPPLYMASDMETPPLETMTETFSTTQTMLKTHILPAVRGGNMTSSYTLVQTYLVTRFVTATKTLPPMDAYHFVPSKTLNEFNSYLDEAGSELNLELAFGDENDNEEGLPRRAFPADLNLANVGSNFDLSDVDKSNLSAHMHLRSKKAHPPTSPRPPMNDPLAIPGLTPEQMALLRLLNPGAAQGQVVTTSKPIIKVETVYESHVLPLFNGHSTILTTISKVLGTVTKTDYEFGTNTINPGIPSIPNIPIPPINGLFQQPQYTVTSSPVVQTTVVTETESKILKLTFGARTVYTTILSTTVVPTVLTTYMTGSVPVQPSVAFPGYFPAPYPAFPYLG